MTIPPIGPAVPTAPVVPAAKPLEAPPSAPEDAYAPAPPQMKALSREATGALFDGTMRDGASVLGQFPTKVVLTDKLAGWQARLTSESSGLSYPIVPLDPAEGRMLVFPHESCAGGTYGVPVVVDSERGPVSTSAAPGLGDAIGFQVGSDPAHDRVFMLSWGTAEVRILDGDLQPVATLQLDGARGAGNLVVGKENAYLATSGDVCNLVAFDPVSGHERWKVPLEGDRTIHGLAETPDGRVVALVTNFDPRQSELHTFEADGKPLGFQPLPSEVHDLAVAGDHAFLSGQDGLQRVGLPGTAPSWNVAEAPAVDWTVEREHKQPQLSPDGKAVIAVNPMSGFYRCHELRSLDAETGEVAWSRKRLGETYLSHRVLPDGIYLLSAVKDETTKEARMTRLDFAGNVLWEASVPGEFDEYETCRRGPITARGEFLLGKRDGTLTCVRARSESDTPESLAEALKPGEEALRKAVEAVRNAEPPARDLHSIDDLGAEVSIGGIRLEKRFSD